MEQLKLPMLTVYEGPRLVDGDIVATCASYRDAVRACWEMRTRTNLTQRQLAEEAGLYAPHVSDYLNLQPLTGKGQERRDLPAKSVNAVEIACGNRFISQWLARQARLPVMDAQFLAHIERMQQRVVA